MKTSPAQQTIVDRCNCMASPAAIQQAEKVPVGGERFLQIAERNPQKKWHKLTRVAFQVSRLMEFCSLRAPQRSDSPHWYTEARLQRYLSAHVARGRRLGQDRPIRELEVSHQCLRLARLESCHRPSQGSCRRNQVRGEIRCGRGGRRRRVVDGAHLAVVPGN
jgi:hypothetical protein